MQEVPTHYHLQLSVKLRLFELSCLLIIQKLYTTSESTSDSLLAEILNADTVLLACGVCESWSDGRRGQARGCGGIMPNSSSAFSKEPPIADYLALGMYSLIQWWKGYHAAGLYTPHMDRKHTRCDTNQPIQGWSIATSTWTTRGKCEKSSLLSHCKTVLTGSNNRLSTLQSRLLPAFAEWLFSIRLSLHVLSYLCCAAKGKKQVSNMIRSIYKMEDMREVDTQASIFI